MADKINIWATWQHIITPMHLVDCFCCLLSIRYLCLNTQATATWWLVNNFVLFQPSVTVLNYDVIRERQESKPKCISTKMWRYLFWKSKFWKIARRQSVVSKQSWLALFPCVTPTNRCSSLILFFLLPTRVSFTLRAAEHSWNQGMTTRGFANAYNLTAVPVRPTQILGLLFYTRFASLVIHRFCWQEVGKAGRRTLLPNVNVECSHWKGWKLSF